MCNPTNSEAFALASALRDVGIPIDEDEFRKMRSLAAGLIIRQTGTCIDSSAWDLPSGGTAYVISMSIWNPSDRPISIIHVDIEAPWPEPGGIRLLEDPHRKRPREWSYDFPGGQLCGIERDIVWNHLLGRNEPVMPRWAHDCLLLAVGEMPIPVEYGDRARARIRVTLFDSRGEKYAHRFDLMLSGRRKASLPDRETVPSRLYASRLALKPNTTGAAEPLRALTGAPLFRGSERFLHRVRRRY